MRKREERGSAYVMALLVLVLVTGYAVAEMTVAIYRDRSAHESSALQQALYIAEAGVSAVQSQLLGQDPGDANSFKSAVEAADGSPVYFPGGGDWSGADDWQAYPEGGLPDGPGFRVEGQVLEDANGQVANMILRSTGRVPHPFMAGQYLERTIVCLLLPVFGEAGSAPPPFDPTNLPVGFEEPICSTDRMLIVREVKIWYFDSDPDPNLLDANGWHTRGGPGLDPNVNWPFDFPTANGVGEPWDPYSGDYGLTTFNVDANTPREDEQWGAGLFSYYEDDPNDATDWAIYLKYDVRDIRGDYFAPLGYFDADVASHMDSWTELYDANNSYYPNVLDSDRCPSEDTAVGYVESLENDPNAFGFGGIYVQKDLNGDGTIDPVAEELNYTNSRAMLAAAAARAASGMDADGNSYATVNDNAVLAAILDANGVSILDPDGDGDLELDRAAIEALHAAGYGDANDPADNSNIRLPGGRYYFDEFRMITGDGSTTVRFNGDTTMYVQAPDANSADLEMDNGTSNTEIVFEGEGEILTNGGLTGQRIIIRAESADANNPTDPDLTIMANSYYSGGFGQVSAEGDVAIYATELMKFGTNANVVAGGNWRPSSADDDYDQSIEDYRGDLLLFSKEIDVTLGSNGISFWGNNVHVYAKYFAGGGGQSQFSCRQNPTGTAVNAETGSLNVTQLLVDNLLIGGDLHINRDWGNANSVDSIRMDGGSTSDGKEDDDMLWYPFQGRMFVNCRGSSPDDAFDVNDLPANPDFYVDNIVDANHFHSLSSEMTDIWMDDTAGGGMWGQLTIGGGGGGRFGSLIIAPGVWTLMRDNKIWGGFIIGRTRMNNGATIEFFFDNYIRTLSRRMDEGPAVDPNDPPAGPLPVDSYTEESRWEDR